MTRSGLSRLWHLLLALIVLAAFCIQIALLLSGGQDIHSGETGEALPLSTRFIRLLSYFTIQSNLLVLMVATSLAVDPQRDGPLWRVLRLDALLGIAVTGVVFVTVLARLVDPHGASMLANIGFHYLSPLMALLGWLMFGPRPRIDARTVALAFVWPVMWLVYTLWRGEASGWYPYPFLNALELGYGVVLRNIALILAGAGVLSLLLWGLERLLPRGSAQPSAGVAGATAVGD